MDLCVRPGLALALAALCAALSGCGVGGSPVTASATSSGTATLSWAAPADNGVPIAAYRVYAGRSVLEYYGSVPATDRRLVVTGLSSGQWFFTATSVSDAGVESVPAEVVSKTIQ
jgi:hypothetical protein